MTERKDEKYIKSKDVQEEEKKNILNFLNTVKTAKELDDAIEFPKERDVGLKVAQRILKERDRLGGFDNLEQLDDVKQVGPERFTEIVKALRGKKSVKDAKGKKTTTSTKRSTYKISTTREETSKFAAARKKVDIEMRAKALKGRQISGQKHVTAIMDNEFTHIDVGSLSRSYKLEGAYAKVRNLDWLEEPMYVLEHGPVILAADLVFKATSQTHPSFPPDESYMSDSSNSFLYGNGLVLVIVDNAIWNDIKTRVNRYVLDLANEGYWADVYTIENANAKNVHDFIISKSPKGVILVGDIPPAFFKHEGSQFPCDLYYMDLSGTWNETDVDNVFDDHTGDVKPEIWVGRLYTPSENGNDVEVLKEYFDRNHDFRRGKLEHRDTALSFVDDDWAGYPKKIRKAWKGLPANFKDGVDAAVKWPYNNKLYIFKNDEYVRYDIDEGEVDDGYPRLIADAWNGFPTEFHSDIDAAVAWPTNDKLYFFKGDKYIRYDGSDNSMDAGYPRLIKDAWNGFPASFANGIEAAFAWPNGKIYFFKDDEYIRYDSAENEMDPGYPRRIRDAWCDFPEEFQQGIDTAAIFPNGKAYFFRTNMFIRYDIDNKCVDKTGFDDCALDSMFSPENIKVITHPNETRALRYKEELNKAWSWVQLCAHSSTQHHAFSADPPSGTVNNAYLRDTDPPDAHFYNLFCCSSGRFTTDEYIAGWYIFDKAGGGNCQGLSCIASAKSGSMLYFEDFYSHMGTGAVIGDAFKEWWEARGTDHGDHERSWFYGLSLLGDPTLSWYKGCVPILTTPNNGEILNHYPRNMTFEWEPVNLAGVRYDVEVDAFGALQSGKWAAEIGQVWAMYHNISAPRYSHTFVGAQRGRWRVRSHIGQCISQWSDWQYFRFTV